MTLRVVEQAPSRQVVDDGSEFAGLWVESRYAGAMRDVDEAVIFVERDALDRSDQPLRHLARLFGLSDGVDRHVLVVDHLRATLRRESQDTSRRHAGRSHAVTMGSGFRDVDRSVVAER
jgi:hypothetical protein